MIFCSGQRTLEEFEQHLQSQEQRRDESSEKLERASHVLVSVKAGVEHLADKLQHLKIVSKCETKNKVLCCLINQHFVRGDYCVSNCTPLLIPFVGSGVTSLCLYTKPGHRIFTCLIEFVIRI